MITTIVLRNYMDKHMNSLVVQSLGTILTPATLAIDLVTYIPGSIINGVTTLYTNRTYKEQEARRLKERMEQSIFNKIK